VKSWISNLAEEKLRPADDTIQVDGWDLVTLRVEKSS
jgi:hypothetical protein